ncbi:ATP-dependent dethiobiotin synthetase BioD [Sphingobium herbicidovorans NBRC 16415]|uniref:ATP-dependent dethiobiotin synthetase BioD n=1 Tax=Sphingobium herbicidovorans (strain ATCC 700291 / DSM 11019 / CCUG 56400 / KCTC 2939 / LMG 18315 / NBRC 16415 / MH) TaxID=1219045 RepID=A0A086PDC6_SPHHM|nr:dethiobiotin synthase [Sphingobium herbicidovorans]KFG91394.1 ATP-dependent dethiobiotin synthetase BioD [Sphingobium herbicidovorans NBRC 16415]
MSRFIVTGTDTDIGKTVFAAGLAGALGAHYWKPVQAGVAPEGDKEAVSRLAGLPAAQILPEAYRLKTPASPHLAARLDGVEISLDRLALPQVDGPLVVEGAGGVLVPVSETLLMADLFAHWGLPVILCARTALGTINHSLLSIEALRSRGVTLAGIAFIGDAHAENERIIPALGRIPSLGRLPHLDPLNAHSLRAAFAANIRLP